jgi:hypothetical protein
MRGRALPAMRGRALPAMRGRALPAMRGRALLAVAVASVALPTAALALTITSHTEPPPAGTYKFYGLGETGKGSLTVRGKTVSKITFTLPTGSAYQQTGCTVPVGATEQSADLVTVSGSFKLVRQNPSVPHGYRYWVVGSVKQPHPANDVGVSPIRAKFNIKGLAPFSGKLGIFFANNGTGVESGSLYADFGGCLSTGGDFDHGYHG